MSDYWSYWLDDGGTWLYSPVGAHQVVDGDGDGIEVVGWRFVTGTASQTGADRAPTLGPGEIAFSSPSQPTPPRSPGPAASPAPSPPPPSNDDVMAYFQHLVDAAGGESPASGQDRSGAPSAPTSAPGPLSADLEPPVGVGAATTTVVAGDADEVTAHEEQGGSDDGLGESDDVVQLEQAATAVDDTSSDSAPTPLVALAVLGAIVVGAVVVARMRSRG